MRDFLLEIHTEELPPKSLKYLAAQLLQEIQARLTKAELKFHSGEYFATPRRLAVLIKKLTDRQRDTEVERKGPARTAAFDANGQPTPACIGFARSVGVMPEQLTTIKTPQGEWMGFKQTVTGESIQVLLPTMVQQAIAALPIPKRMRWSDQTIEFVRPVHSIVMLYGDDVISASILGLQSDRKTRGHRFHSKGWIEISNPGHYLKQLEKKYVLVGFEERKEKIRSLTIDALKQLAEKTHEDLHAEIDETLLEEVTGLVEWPNALCGYFDREFLSIPQEVLISAMQDHQRYFPIVNQARKLQPYFVAISNIESKNPKQVSAGNERVLRARLSDAKFFFDTDLKYSLSSRVDDLKQVVYQQKLGTLYDKAARISDLAKYIAQIIGSDPENAREAGVLAKADLTTQLVGEFPELQGVAGYYYATHDKALQDVAKAIREHYLPRFSGDVLPSALTGCAVAIADRLDTLVGIFGMNQIPTGDKDPFGLRRAALGILRIVIEKKLPLDLRDLLEFSLNHYQIALDHPTLIDAVLQFMLERLKPWYQEQMISTDVFSSVYALNITKPYDFHCRIQAVQAFKELPEATALSIANKRVSNILNQYSGCIEGHTIRTDLLQEEAEQVLAKTLAEKRHEIVILAQSKHYAAILASLASLRGPVDDFFDKVLVMTEDQAIRENRLLLLKQLRELFLYVADIALLQ